MPAFSSCSFFDAFQNVNVAPWVIARTFPQAAHTDLGEIIMRFDAMPNPNKSPPKFLCPNCLAGYFGKADSLFWNWAARGS